MCKRHQFFVNPEFPNETEEVKPCHCWKIGPFQLCKYCAKVRFVLNFCAKKVCLKESPEYIDKIKSLDEYLKKDIKCESFFFFDEEKTSLVGKLDNPGYFDIINSVKHVGN